MKKFTVLMFTNILVSACLKQEPDYPESLKKLHKETDVCLRGHRCLEVWNPHNGTNYNDIQHEYLQMSGENFTRFALALEPVRSLFYTGINQ